VLKEPQAHLIKSDGCFLNKVVKIQESNLKTKDIFSRSLLPARTEQAIK
jgi:hypothetical protein